MNCRPSDTPIKATSQKICINCGSTGTELYSKVRDHLFNAPGEWNLRRCDNSKCGLLWLDPMPHPNELHQFYQTYYTHGHPDKKSSAESDSARMPRRLRVHSRQNGYLASHFGYGREKCSWWTWLLGLTLWFVPGKRMRTDLSVMHLPAVPNGRVLDVGCGSGDVLENLQQLGWQVEGVDFDPKAVLAARSRGLCVHLGSLFDLSFPADSFDAVVMCHLIEHVPDPLGLIRECKRILKPGGRLVVVTPNPHSLSHRLFGRAWRGLEPPRHLYIQTRASLAAIISAAGFPVMELKTSARFAKGMFLQSLEIRQRQMSAADSRLTTSQRRLCGFLDFIEVGMLSCGLRSIGEEQVCIAKKGSATHVIESQREERRVA